MKKHQLISLGLLILVLATTHNTKATCSITIMNNTGHLAHLVYQHTRRIALNPGQRAALPNPNTGEQALNLSLFLKEGIRHEPILTGKNVTLYLVRITYDINIPQNYCATLELKKLLAPLKKNIEGEKDTRVGDTFAIEPGIQATISGISGTRMEKRGGEITQHQMTRKIEISHAPLVP